MAAALLSASTLISSFVAASSSSSASSRPRDGRLPLKSVSLSSSAHLSSQMQLLQAMWKSREGKGVLGAQMVTVPTVKQETILDFETSVFKKEKVTLHGHDEADAACKKV